MLVMTKKRELTEEENNFKIALRVGNISTEDKTLVQVLRTFKAVSEKGDDTTIREISAIEIEVEALYPEIPGPVAREEKEESKKEEELSDETVNASL